MRVSRTIPGRRWLRKSRFATNSVWRLKSWTYTNSASMKLPVSRSAFSVGLAWLRRTKHAPHSITHGHLSLPITQETISTHRQNCPAQPMTLNHPLLLALLGLSLPAALSAKAADRPNILLVVNDDQGYGDASCFGAKDLQ